jgi:lipoprotein-anchoring transpeptidase ErfK/SrfK
MRKINRNSKRTSKATWLLAILLMATFEALAQTKQQPSRQVLVSIPDRKLAVLENGRVLKVFPVAVGADDSPSPSGEFRIINRLTDPTYYHKGTVIGPGPANPLGSRWIGLNLKGYGIHGTNAPRSIGKAASHGCIRMAKRDLLQLFDMVRAGDSVVIHADADEQTAQVFGTGETVVAQEVSTEAADTQSTSAVATDGQ